MTNRYAWVAWNRHKKVYDLIVVGAVVAFIGLFVGATVVLSDNPPDPVTMMMRATGVAGLVLLHVILCIGPLARLSDRFNAVLYNRRHMGVTLGVLATVHFVLAVFWYALFGAPGTNPLFALLTTGKSMTVLSAFPFELLGFLAYLIIALMAATSHDFWLKQLSPGWWKALHMLVYVAYALLLGHVALGSMRDSVGLTVPVLLGAGALVVGGLHAAAGVREIARDAAGLDPDALAMPDEEDGAWIRVCTVDEIPEKRARVVSVAGRERIAVFKHDGTVSAVTNVCAHQGGPLGEGKIVDGCITCPWHGYQYRPEDGCSPPPYDEKIATYRVRVNGRDVLLDPRPVEPGMAGESAHYARTADEETDLFESVEKTARAEDLAARDPLKFVDPEGETTP